MKPHVLAVVLLVGHNAFVDAQGTSDSMKGLIGVHVIVQEPSKEAEKDGLTKASIQTDVEVKLRLAGIRVLTREETLKAPGKPYIYVNVDTLRNPSFPFYAYNVRVELFQEVESVVRAGVMVSGITWQNTRVGSVGASNLREVRDDLKDDMDKFVNDWLTANPPVIR